MVDARSDGGRTRRSVGLGLSHEIELAPYLPEDVFRETFSSAVVVVLPSAFEGFGLPILEGMMLGTPVVIGPEVGSLATAGGHATVLRDWSPASVVDAVTLAVQVSAASLQAARAHAEGFTWTACATRVRELLERIVAL